MFIHNENERKVNKIENSTALRLAGKNWISEGKKLNVCITQLVSFY